MNAIQPHKIVQAEAWGDIFTIQFLTPLGPKHARLMETILLPRPPLLVLTYVRVCTGCDSSGNEIQNYQTTFNALSDFLCAGYGLHWRKRPLSLILFCTLYPGWSSFLSPVVSPESTNMPGSWAVTQNRPPPPTESRVRIVSRMISVLMSDPSQCELFWFVVG